MQENEYSKKQLVHADKFFQQQASFVLGVNKIDQLPTDKALEIAFAGRSNVGKSSLINALTNRNNLAKSSKTPGRTQQLNFFTLGEQIKKKIYLVDLPGYGYAKASKTAIKYWNQLIMDYLKGRPNLARVMLLVDSRHGLKENDKDIMQTLDDAAVAYQIVLTKCDKVKQQDLQKLLKLDYTKHPAMHPIIIGTSSEKKTGLSQLRAEILKML